MTLRLHRGAERDLADAADFYAREASPALARRFLAEFRRVAALIAANPEIGAPRPNDRRALSMQVFPYAVVYRVLGGDILVLVVRHHRRRPGFGEARS